MRHKLKVLFYIITLVFMTGYLCLNQLTTRIGMRQAEISQMPRMSASRPIGAHHLLKKVVPTMSTGLNGRLAPNVHLNSLSDQSQISLDQYKEKNTLLVAWTTWCAECRKELQLLKSNPPKNVSIILVNLTQTESSLNKVKEFVKGEGLFFPVAIDSNGAFQRAYSIKVIPTSILVGPKGHILHIFYGPMNKTTVEKWLPQ